MINLFKSKAVNIVGLLVLWVTVIPTICGASSETAIAISAGAYHTVALKGDGTVVAWGDNSLGQSGVPSELKNVIAVSAGAYHTVALKDDGTIVAWGDNSMGQLNIPAGLRNLKAVAAGFDHTVALKNDGTVVAWGNDSYGQTKVPSGLKNVITIAVGFDHSLALRSDGTLVAWGDNSVGQSTVPTGLGNVSAMAAGWVHSVALKKDGTVVAWGANNYGQTEVPADLGDVSAIAAGAYYTVVLKRNGSVRAWGDNTSGQREFPSGLRDVTAIAAGTAHAVALTRDGTIIAAGDNSYGQITIPLLRGNISPRQAVDAGAQWSKNGGATWNGGGMSVLTVPGDYTITFKPVPGWQTPSDQTISAGRGPSSFNGTYKLSFTATTENAGSGTITTDTNGIVCSGMFCEGTVDFGTIVVVDASAGEGYRFSSWKGCDLTRGTQCLITMKTEKTATASFSRIQYPLSVKIAGAGKGTLSTPTQGVNCSESSCSGTLDYGEGVVIDAQALEGSKFLDWAGCDSSEGTRCAVTMNGAKTVTAVFTVAP